VVGRDKIGGGGQGTGWQRQGSPTPDLADLERVDAFRKDLARLGLGITKLELVPPPASGVIAFCPSTRK
jgi:hypothetical protein